MTLPKNIYYLGPKFSFGHIASMKYFASDDNFIPATEFVDLFKNITNNDFAVVPIENSIAGSVIPNFDYLYQYDVDVVGEINLCINHYLFALPNTKLENIQTIYSHPKALEQCQKYLKNLSENQTIQTQNYSSTAGAIQMVSQSQNSTFGAIGSGEAGQHYGLVALDSNIQDQSSNWTRFLVITSKQNATQNTNQIKNKTIKNKASLVFKLPHIQGSLVKVLGILSKHQLLKIESRPIADRPFEYVFYVDILFDSYDIFLQDLELFSKTSLDTRILGIYKQSV